MIKLISERIEGEEYLDSCRFLEEEGAGVRSPACSIGQTLEFTPFYTTEPIACSPLVFFAYVGKEFGKRKL